MQICWYLDWFDENLTSLIYMYVAVTFRTPCSLLMSFPHKTNCLPTDEFPSSATVTAGYNWKNVISILVLVAVAVIGAVIGTWLLPPSVGKP